MDSSLFWYALAALGAFIAIWFFVVVPSEKRHHERKLAIIRERMEKRRAEANDASGNGGRDDSDAADRQSG